MTDMEIYDRMVKQLLRSYPNLREEIERSILGAMEAGARVPDKILDGVLEDLEPCCELCGLYLCDGECAREPDTNATPEEMRAEEDYTAWRVGE